jgi:hypothetical protein
MTKASSTTTTTSPALELGRDAAERLRAAMEQSDLARKARDAAYTLVGLGVMGAQRANVATRQAVARLGVDDTAIDLEALRGKTKDLSTTARRQFLAADEVLEGALARIEEALSPLEGKLPGSARETVDRVKVAGRELHAQVRTLVAGASDDAEAPATASAAPAAKGSAGADDEQ